MTDLSEAVRKRLAAEDDEFRAWVREHREHEGRLAILADKRTLSLEEEVEEKQLKKKNGEKWEKFTEAIETWSAAVDLLESWGNRASHGGTLTRAEAEQLIAICEKSLAAFRCAECDSPVWQAQAPKLMQCSCGLLCWK